MKKPKPNHRKQLPRSKGQRYYTPEKLLSLIRPGDSVTITHFGQRITSKASILYGPTVGLYPHPDGLGDLRAHPENIIRSGNRIVLQDAFSR